MDKTLAEKLRYLRLWGLLEHWDEWLREATKRNYSGSRLLTRVIDEEHRIRTENARQMRLQRAGIPRPLRIDTFPFTQQPRLDRKKLMAVYDGFDYMTRARNVIWIGPTGCGKTGLATAFLLQAIDRGYRGRHVLFSELIAELYAAVADHTLQKVYKRYLSYACLLIDEVGYVEVEAEQAGLFFALMQKRHQTHTTLITSNLGFDDWGGFLKNPHLTAALLDRLTESSHVFNMKRCRSLRKPLEGGASS